MGILQHPTPPRWPETVTAELIRLWRLGTKHTDMLAALSKLWARPVSIGMLNGKTWRLIRTQTIEPRERKSSMDISTNEDGAHKLHYDNLAKLPMWVIYNQTTREYPGIFVSRLHFTIPEQIATEFVLLAPTLDELRAKLPEASPACTVIPRMCRRLSRCGYNGRAYRHRDWPADRRHH